MSRGRLLLGDNVAVLRALHSELAAGVRLAYLDPPYNIGVASDHYADRLAPADWAAAFGQTLDALLPLLRPDGVLCIQTDKTEQATVRQLTDARMGRAAFVTTLAVRMSATSGFKIEHTEKTLVKNVEFIHVYAHRLSLHGRAYEPADYDAHYSLRLMGEGETLRVEPLTADPVVAGLLAEAGLPPHGRSLPALYARSAAFRAYAAAQASRIVRAHTAPAPARREQSEGQLFAADAPADQVLRRRYGADDYYLRPTRSGVNQLIPLSLKLRPVDRVGGPDEVLLTNILGDWWDTFHLDMGNVEVEGGVEFKNGKKPERLLRRLIQLFTLPGDWVLDPYGGSGTTAAVAHKMGRPWLTIEAGPQGLSHIAPRLRRIVDGADLTGVTAATGWAGGGAFGVERLDEGWTDFVPILDHPPQDEAPPNADRN
jgi:adenine-specific DNA-methyltransferase